MENCIRRAAWQTLELLEDRRLMASISGTIIEDLDNDGQRDGRERTLAGTTVFLDQNRNRQLDNGEQSLVTDASGFYEFTGLAPGQYFVAQLPPQNYGQNYPSKGGFGNFGHNYNIRLQFADGVSEQIRSIAASAAARWEKVLVGDLPDAFTDKYGDIDDILIEVFAKKIDGNGGVLAFAGPRLTRDSTDPEAPNLPYLSSATFDTSDAKDPALYETAVHEFGHALGFTLNTWFNFTDDSGKSTLIAGNVALPKFLGKNAVREFNTIFGTNVTGVPLQDYTAGSGSSFSHWSEVDFGNELMSPFSAAAGLGEPMSRITVAAMQDIGYKVNYRAADPYDPAIQNLPTTQPDTAGGGLVDFEYTITIASDSEQFQGRDFSSRQNQRPTLDAVRAENALYATGDVVKLRAVGAFDNDNGDAVQAVGFYVESNSIPGLQTGAGGDTWVGSDDSPDGGFRINARTGRLALTAGTYTFYARPYDELFVAGKPKAVEVHLFDPTVAPTKPLELNAVSISSSRVSLEWMDRSDNEFGFQIDRARDQFFTKNVKRFTLSDNVTSFEDKGLSSGTTYYYRIRSFNIAGPSSFIGPVTVLTANLGDKIIDVNSSLRNLDPGISTRGDIFAQDDRDAIFGESLGISGGGRINFSPMTDYDGDYFLYAKWSTPTSENGKAVFDILDARGKQQRAVTVDQNTQGTENGYVLIGKYNFNTLGDGAITFSPLNRSQTVNLDAIRLLPAFDPTTR